MKVKVLIEKMKHADGDLQLLCCKEGNGLAADSEHFREGIAAADATTIH
jgi:hypothetical protein